MIVVNNTINVNTIWDLILNSFEFDRIRWLCNLIPFGIEKDILILKSPNDFIKSWIENNLIDDLNRAASQFDIKNVKIIIDESLKDIKLSSPEKVKTSSTGKCCLPGPIEKAVTTLIDTSVKDNSGILVHDSKRHRMVNNEVGLSEEILTIEHDLSGLNNLDGAEKYINYEVFESFLLITKYCADKGIVEFPQLYGHDLTGDKEDVRRNHKILYHLCTLSGVLIKTDRFIGRIMNYDKIWYNHDCTTTGNKKYYRFLENFRYVSLRKDGKNINWNSFIFLPFDRLLMIPIKGRSKAQFVNGRISILSSRSGSNFLELRLPWFHKKCQINTSDPGRSKKVIVNALEAGKAVGLIKKYNVYGRGKEMVFEIECLK